MGRDPFTYSSEILRALTEDFDRRSCRWVHPGSSDWEQVNQLVAGLTSEELMAGLREAVARMPELRHQDARGRGRLHDRLITHGTALYTFAVNAYAARHLRPTRDDVCWLLEASSHDCGHGEDVTPPFELAMAHLRRTGPDQRVFTSVAAMRQGLAGLSSTKSHNLRRKADYLLLADPLTTSPRPCWADAFRTGIHELQAEHTIAWQRFVIETPPVDRPAPTRRFDTARGELAGHIDLGTIASHLDEWIPRPGSESPISTSGPGSHLLKHFAWLLPSLDSDQAEELATRIVRIDWTRKRNDAELARKAVDAATRFLTPS